MGGGQSLPGLKFVVRCSKIILTVVETVRVAGGFRFMFHKAHPPYHVELRSEIHLFPRVGASPVQRHHGDQFLPCCCFFSLPEYG